MLECVETHTLKKHTYRVAILCGNSVRLAALLKNTRSKETWEGSPDKPIKYRSCTFTINKYVITLLNPRCDNIYIYLQNTTEHNPLDNCTTPNRSFSVHCFCDLTFISFGLERSAFLKCQETEKKRREKMFPILADWEV